MEFIKPVKKIVEAIAGEDCGCDKRKETLNKLFPYNNGVQCLEESEYKTLKDWFDQERNTVTPNEQTELRKIYNRVFKKNSSPSSCSSCVRDMIDRLRSVYNEYENKNV